MTEADFKYTVRDGDTVGDRRFILETIARVRQPHVMAWRDWEPYGLDWARGCLDDADADECKVVESDGVILAFIVTVAGHVEMLYVKREFRGLGFGQLLIDAAGIGDNVPVRAPTDSFRMWARHRGIRFTVVE